MTNRKQLAIDRLLVLKYLRSNDENTQPLIHQCESLLESNNSDDIEQCIDLLYEQFESSFTSGELLESFSNLIKQSNK